LAGVLDFAFTFPAFLIVSMGLTLHNTIATLEGYAGKKSPFIRTPKFNLVNNGDSWREKKYSATRIDVITALEFFLWVIFSFVSASAFWFSDFTFFPFQLTFALGYGVVIYYSAVQSAGTSLAAES
jgi:hypothetical protein